MSLSETVKSFNSILEDFLQQISPLIGTTYHHYFKQVIKVNAILPIQHFIHYVFDPEYSLEDKIINRDETYFTNEKNHKNQVKNQDNALMEIVRLKGIYVNLSKDSKDNVWDILFALVHLSKDYIKLKK